jgi:hypothetical protein
MEDTGTPSRTEDEIDELLLELGLQYVGITEGAAGERLIRFRFVDRDKNEQWDVTTIGQRVIALLETARSTAIQHLWRGVRGVVIE